MPDIVESRMLELLSKFKKDIAEVQETRSAKLFSVANSHLLEIYNHHLAHSDAFRRVRQSLKTLYASFNYSAAIVNEARKRRSLTGESAEMLDECLENMLRCCTVIENTLKKKKQ